MGLDKPEMEAEKKSTALALRIVFSQFGGHMAARFRVHRLIAPSLLPSLTLFVTVGCSTGPEETQSPLAPTGSTTGDVSVAPQTSSSMPVPAVSSTANVTTSSPTSATPQVTTGATGVATSSEPGEITSGAPTTTGGDVPPASSEEGSSGTAAEPSASTSEPVETTPSGNGEYNPDFKEFVGEDCEVAEPQDVNIETLPDLFEKLDGSRMTKKSEWSCRRAEIKRVVEKYIHGEKPGRPEVVTGTVSGTTISVHVEHDGKSIDFSVAVSLPGGGTGPVPAIIGLGGGSLPANLLKAEGVATINYNNGNISSETSRSGLFSNLYGSTGASAQVGWAWGVSRIIDVLVDEKAAGRNDIIDPTAIGVTGCSRLGKGAFTIGAFDERIALGIPQESGTGGVSAFRIVNTNPQGPNGKGAQTLASAWSEAQGWFGTAFGEYRNNVNVIPGDTHSLVAMYAPRGLLVLDNSRIGELGASAQHAATVAGGEVFKALGVEKNVAYHGGNPSDPHNHCAFYASQEEPLKRAIRAHLTRTAEPDGRMEPQAAGTADLAKWIEWQAPMLE